MDPIATNPAFVIFAAICPVLIAFVRQQALSAQANTLIALACYVAIGILGALFSGYAFTLDNVVAMVTVATIVGSAAYNLFWSQLGSPSVLVRLETATSILKLPKAA